MISLRLGEKEAVKIVKYLSKSTKPVIRGLCNKLQAKIFDSVLEGGKNDSK